MSPPDLKQALSDSWFDCIDRPVLCSEPTLHPRLTEIFGILGARWPSAVISVRTAAETEKAAASIVNLLASRSAFRLCVDFDGGHSFALIEAAARKALASESDWSGLSVSFHLGPSKPLPTGLYQLAKKYGATIALNVAESNGWTEAAIADLEETLWAIPDQDLVSAPLAHAIPTFLRKGRHLPCRAPIDSIVVGPDLMVSYCRGLGPACSLVNYPTYYGEMWEWIDAAETARDGGCFKRACFGDESHALAYTKPSTYAERFQARFRK